MGERLSRRKFLGASGAGGVLLAGQLRGAPPEGDQDRGGAPRPPVRIHKVYVGRRGMAWPKPEIDLRAEVARFDRVLAEAERQLGDVRFVGGELVGTPAQAAQVVARVGLADGVLVFHLTLGTGALLAQIVNAHRPTAIFSQPFSGHEWMAVADWRRQGRKVVLLATSDTAELAQVAAVMRVPARLPQTRILLVGGAAGTARDAAAIRARLGPQVVPVTVQQLIEAHRAVEAQAAQAEAEQWVRQARRVVEPSREEIVKSARMHLAMRRLLTDQRAQAITIRCLGGIPIHILGYPCLGFSRLCDDGLVGACEADMDSTLTMVMFQYAFGVPGFISDPLFDTSHNAVIHAHCTAPTRMAGPTGPRAPYLIRSHRDDNRGASLEVQMRVGQAVTCAKLINLDTMLLSAGRITAIPDFDDRGCRTQITTEVRDAHAMLANWGGGVLRGDMMTRLHRVVFYGDHRRGVEHLATLMGLRVVEEG